MLKRPLVTIGIAFAVGIAASDYMSALIIIFAGAASAMLSVMHRAKYHSALLLFLIFITGSFRSSIYSRASVDDISRYISRRPPVLIGTVVSEPEVKDDRICYIVKAERTLVAGRWIECSGKIWTTEYDPDQPFPSYGDKIAARVNLFAPVEPGNPGGFSWKRHLERQGIYSVARVSNYAIPRRILLRQPRSASRMIASARTWMMSGVDDTFNSQSAAIIKGVTFGRYSLVPPDLAADFSSSGTLHLLAASGFNCGVLIAALSYVLRKLHTSRYIRHPAMMLSLIMYMLIVGMTPSIVRATVVAVLGLLAVILKRPADLINLLFGAGLFILWRQPSDLYDVGFQLSFAAVMGILLLLPVMKRLQGMKHEGKSSGSPIRRTLMKLKRDTIEALTATAAAGAATAPITAQAFNQVSLVSLPANAAVAFTVLPVFITGLLAPVAVHIPVLSAITATIGNTGAGIITASVHFFGNNQFSTLSVPSPGWIGIAGYYVILSAFIRYVSDNIKKK